MSGVVLTGGAIAATIANGAVDEAPAAAGTTAQVPWNVRQELPSREPIRPAHVAKHARAHRVSRAHVRRPLTGSPRTIAHALVLRQGWSEMQFGCLDRLWTRESNWEVSAQNSSGAYGIPQALPASKMAMMGSDWRTNAITQIRWGIWYIADAYGTPCIALQHSYNYNYY
jgi:hypothetical protein